MKKQNPKPKTKTVAGGDSRMPDWALRLATLKKEFVAYEAAVAIQQEILKGMAAQGKQWGIDLERVTAMSRDAFDRVGKAAEVDESKPAGAARRRAR